MKLFDAETLRQRDQEMQKLQVELESIARRNGKLEFANHVAEWVHRNAARIPEDVRADLAEWLLREIA